MEEFSFPFSPYDIQLDLMREIKMCIEKGQIGIFESPTGTGKTLSLICATLSWLEDFEKEYEIQLVEKAKVPKEGDSNDVDWIAAYKKKFERHKEADEAMNKLDVLRRVQAKLEGAMDGFVKNGRKRKTKEVVAEELNSVDELAPPELYNSDEETTTDDLEEKLECVKIYYASRTHSQLEQLTEELNKTRFKPRIVTVASRQTLCANEDVKRLKLNHLINEKCMELRKNGSGDKRSRVGESKEPTRKICKASCSYYNSDSIEELSNGILANYLNQPDEVLKSGRQRMACPYFATRKAIPLCQLILLPYQVLLHSATRIAWGINLKGNVVILDEAHNVLQTIVMLFLIVFKTNIFIIGYFNINSLALVLFSFQDLSILLRYHLVLWW